MIDSDVPKVEARDLQEELKRYLNVKRAHHMFAVYGTGDEQVLKFDTAGDVRVVPVRSELDLRAKMPGLADADPRVVFLVPWTEDIPIDLRGRFVRDGRVIRVGREARLKRLFGVLDVDADAVRGALTDYLLGRSAPFSVGESRLTLEAMWAAWLKRDWDLETDGGLALDALLSWAALSARGKAWDLAMAGSPQVETQLLTHLEESVGPAAPVAFRAWKNGEGDLLLQLAVLFEGLLESNDPAARMWAKQHARAELKVTDEAKLSEVIAALGKAAPAALRYVERKADAAKVRALVRAADDRVDDSEVRAALAGSLRLPSAFNAQLDAFGDVLLAAAAEPTPANVTRAADLLHRVEAHALASENARRLERALMAVRLVAWLAARPDKQRSIGAAPHAPVETLGEWYAEEGGYVDWARKVARGTSESRFDKGIQAAVHAADAARAALDHTFAVALTEWVSAGRPAHQVLPIDKALDRIAVPFLDESPARKLLIVLMDGMAWAQAVELLDSLQSRPCAPLAWHASKKGRIGDGHYPVVLAALPSVTELSRSAFFAGKNVPNGKSEDTQKDRDRFRDHKQISKYFTGSAVPTLLLRAENQTKGGAATEEALRLVADTDRRVVAVVVNAIDDSLKSNPSVRHAWGVDNVKVLADLMDKARASGRAVLLASDHGHVPADLLEFRGSLAGGGARWRPLASSTDPTQPFEVKFSGERAWAPKGSWGVALMADDTGRWGGSTHAGEHGGATLAEVVAPCILVGHDELEGLVPDEGLRLRDHYVPTWWALYVEQIDMVRTPEPAAVAAKTRSKSPPKEQLALLPELAPPPPVPAETLVTKPGASPKSPFAKSGVLEARAPDAKLRDEIARAVDFLLARNGVAAIPIFAAEMRIPERRVGGKVAQFQEVLNVDGYDVLRYDVKEVTLDVGKLRMLFEVP